MNPTREDYIRAIYLENIKLKRNILEKELCLKLNLAKSTVSERIKSLEKTAYVIKDNGLYLTKKGMMLAKKLTYRHRLIEVFLHDKLKMDEKEIHKEADLLEHGFSDNAIKKLERYLNKPKKCPHGGDIN